MRIKSQFGNRVSDKREPKKKYYMVYEGIETEVQYFDGIKEIIENGRKQLIEIIPIFRSFHEENWSNPTKIVQLMKDFFSNETEKEVELFVNKIIDFINQDGGLCSVFNMDAWKKHILDRLLELGIQKTDKISKDKCLESINTIFSELSLKDLIPQLHTYFESQKVTYSKDFDKICLIVDRDKQSFKEDQYDEVLKACQDNHYELYITNPCFEFWLLLHFDEVNTIDRAKLLENKKPKAKAKDRFITKELKKLLIGYRKNDIKFGELKNRITNAIRNEKLFCEDILSLKTELGSNVGTLIDELM